MCHCNQCFLFFYVRALDLCFSLWHSYLVNAVDTFNNLCLFSCLCTFSSAFVPVGQLLWPFLLLLPGGNSFCISCLPCCALFSFFLFLLRYFVWQHSTTYCLATFQPQKAISCFLVSFQWNESGSFPFLLYLIIVYDLGNSFFFMLDYCTADQNTVIFLFFDDCSKCSI